MQEVINKLNNIISLELAKKLTSEQEHYVAGLSDALDVVKTTYNSRLIVGKFYYVIVYEDKTHTMPKVEKMRLYKISECLTKTVYCFTLSEFDKIKYPDLTLSSPASIASRVFETRSEAMAQIL